MTSAAVENQFDFNVLFLVALPVHHRPSGSTSPTRIHVAGSSQGVPEPVRRRPARGHLGMQVGWIITTTVIVIGCSSSAPSS